MNKLCTRILVFLILLCFCPRNGISQSDLRIGDWKAHLPFRKSFHVTQSENSIFYATEWGLLGIDKSDRSPTFLTKVNGLSDVGLSLVKYDMTSRSLVVTYGNSNIDLITEEEVINLNEIERNDQILGDKTIHHILLDDQKAYLSCAFGLVELDLNSQEFGFTTFTPFSVNSSVLFEERLYIATENGIYHIEFSPTINFQDFGQWTLLAASGLPNGNALELGVFADHLYAVVNDILYKQTNNVFETVFADPNFSIQYISTEGSKLMVGLRKKVERSSRVLFFDPAGQFMESPVNCHFQTTYALQNGQEVWYADEGDGFRTANQPTAACEALFFNSPFSHNVSEIKVYDGITYVAAGGVNAAFSYQFRRDGLFLYDNQTWDFFNTGTSEELRNIQGQFWDIFTLAQHPITKNIFVGSYLEGLIEYQEGQVLQYFDQSNSSIGGTVGDNQRERISGLTFDEQGNLWVSNYLASRPMSVFTAEGEWQSFNFAVTTLTQSAIDRNGFKWIVVKGNSAGLLVWDTGQDPLSAADDRSIFLNKDNSELTTNNVNCVEADLDGVIWVGTAEGPIIFNCNGNDIFEGDCSGFQKQVIQDFKVSLLLDKENIQTIAVDGANQKWFGTRNGVFVQSPNGDDLISFFNEANSPLLDNNVIDIAIDPTSGEVFIGTNKGIVEYKSTATKGPSRHIREAVVYPNPVRPEYEGPIAIQGLARDADIIITDMAGQLVYKTKAQGGQAIWYGLDLNGVKAASGVYLVYSTSTQSFDTPDAYVTKILLLK